MAEYKTVKVPQMDGQDLTKAQEIEIINKFYEALPEGSYLKSIFKGLPGYCEQQIENDWGISPLETIDHQYKEAGEHRAKVAQVEKERDAALEERNRAQQEAKAATEALAAQKDLTENWVKSFKEKQLEAHELNAKVQDQAQEIIKLKAKLYDLMVQGQ